MTETSPAPRTERLAKRLAAGLVAACAVVMLFAVAYIHASQATDQARDAAATARAAAAQAQKTADCVNRILGARAPLLAADHANERAKIDAQIVAQSDIEAGVTRLASAKTSGDVAAGVAAYKRGVDEFNKALTDWKARDDQISKQKLLAPLGRC